MIRARRYSALLLLLPSLMLSPAAAADSTQLTISVRNGTEVVAPAGMTAHLTVSCRVDTQSTEKRLAFDGGSIVCPIPSGATVEIMINYLLYAPLGIENAGKPMAKSFRLNVGWMRQLKVPADTELVVTLPRAQRLTFNAVDSDGKTMPSATFNLSSNGGGVYGRMSLDNTGAEYVLAVREWLAWKAEPNYELIGFDATGAFDITAERDGTSYTWQSGTTKFTNGAKLTACIDTGRGKYSGSNVTCAQSRTEEIEATKLRNDQMLAAEFQKRANDLLLTIDSAISKYGSKATELTSLRKKLELLIAKNPGAAGLGQVATLKNTVDAITRELAATKAAIKAGQACTAAQLGKTTTSNGTKLKCTKAKGAKSPTWTRLP